MKSKRSGEIGTLMIIVMGVMLVGTLIFGKKSGMMGMMCGAGHEDHSAHSQKKADGAVSYAKDPVCGMAVEMSPASLQSLNNGATYYFCSEEDKKKFDSSPADFIK